MPNHANHAIKLNSRGSDEVLDETRQSNTILADLTSLCGLCLGSSNMTRLWQNSSQVGDLTRFMIKSGQSEGSGSGELILGGFGQADA